MYNANQDSTVEEITEEQQNMQWSTISLREATAWVLVVILTVLFTGLLSVVLLWMFKKRQARDTSTDNSTPKYEMEGTLVMKPLQSNRSLTHTSMKQSEGEGTSKGRQMKT